MHLEKEFSFITYINSGVFDKLTVPILFIQLWKISISLWTDWKPFSHDNHIIYYYRPRERVGRDFTHVHLSVCLSFCLCVTVSGW